MEIDVPKACLHQSLEGCRGAGEPKRHLFTLISPMGPTVNAVSGLLSSSILTCQYPDFRSSDENHWEPCRLSRVSSIWGTEYASLTVQLFSFLRLIQRPPNFFWTRTTVLAYGLCDLQIAPISSIFWIWALMSSYIWGVCISNSLWKESDLLTILCVSSEQFFPDPGCCVQIGAPIWAVALWPVSPLIQAILWDLGGPKPPRPILLVICYVSLQ